MNKCLHILAVALFALAFAACDGTLFFDRQCEVDEHGWPQHQWTHFDVEVEDTNTVYNFLLEVRNTVDYPYANTFFFVRTTFPDGSSTQDTLEYPLADLSGRWLGKRTGRFVDTRYYFRRNARFPMAGHYDFAVSHGLRDSALVGMRSIGLRIEYSDYISK